MLNHLYIKNFALIEELDLEVQNGFTVITGETGAGKSIMLGAIALLMGERAESRHIQEGAGKCIIEARFNIKAYQMEALFEACDLDYEEECLVRRELTATGKSRAYINDTPVNLNTLKEITGKLLDIHSQHQNLLLNQENFQLNVVDTMAQSRQLCLEYTQAYNHYKETEKSLLEAREEAEKQRAEEDYIRFQYQQLKEFSPIEDEENELEEEQNQLTHAEDIKTGLYETDALLNDEHGRGILENVRQARQLMHSLSRIYPRAEEFEERFDNLYIEIKDIASEIENLAEGVEYNPQRLELVNQRLDELYTLQKKHNANSSAELKAIMLELEKKLSHIEHSEERIETLEEELKKAFECAQLQAESLSKIRKEAAKHIEDEVQHTLASLGMPNVCFQVEIKDKDRLTSTGKDSITFTFSANKSVSPKPISQVASGGEIARVMLAIKAMTSQKTQLPTIIFDEIDTGVSGSIAESMALIMGNMCKAEHRQVITITHLPQIAACGTSHLKVYKTDEGNKTTSHICQLTPDERIKEIANMLSGNKVTDAAIKNAKELLKK